MQEASQLQEAARRRGPAREDAAVQIRSTGLEQVAQCPHRVELDPKGVAAAGPHAGSRPPPGPGASGTVAGKGVAQEKGAGGNFVGPGCSQER